MVESVVTMNIRDDHGNVIIPKGAKVSILCNVVITVSSGWTNHCVVAVDEKTGESTTALLQFFEVKEEDLEHLPFIETGK